MGLPGSSRPGPTVAGVGLTLLAFGILSVLRTAPQASVGYGGQGVLAAGPEDDEVPGPLGADPMRRAAVSSSRAGGAGSQHRLPRQQQQRRGGGGGGWGSRHRVTYVNPPPPPPRLPPSMAEWQPRPFDVFEEPMWIPAANYTGPKRVTKELISDREVRRLANLPSVRDAVFAPTRGAEIMLSGTGQPTMAPFWNPSVAELPAAWVDCLPPKARYLLAGMSNRLRKTGHQCPGSYEWALQGMRYNTDRQAGEFVVLDARLRPLVRLPRPEALRQNADFRLLRIGQALYLTSNLLAEQQFGRLRLLPECGGLEFKVEHTEVGRNIGLSPDGDRMLLWMWLARQQTVPAPRAGQAFVPLDPGSRLGVDGQFQMHNNGSPLLLEEHGVLLALGHIHMNQDAHQTRLMSLGQHSGSLYFHYFLLMDPAPPFAVRARSPPFCFASERNGGACDPIQFVMSTILTGRNDLLLTYGINDCEGAAVRLSVRKMLRFARNETQALEFVGTAY